MNGIARLAVPGPSPSPSGCPCSPRSHRASRRRRSPTPPGVLWPWQYGDAGAGLSGRERHQLPGVTDGRSRTPSGIRCPLAAHDHGSLDTSVASTLPAYPASGPSATSGVVAVTGRSSRSPSPTTDRPCSWSPPSGLRDSSRQPARTPPERRRCRHVGLGASTEPLDIEGLSVRTATIRPSDQAFEQELELADLDLDVERVVEGVEDRDGQRPVVAVAFELADDPAVLDLALADADLELARASCRCRGGGRSGRRGRPRRSSPPGAARGCSGWGRASGRGRGRPCRARRRPPGRRSGSREWVSTASTSPSRIAKPASVESRRTSSSKGVPSGAAGIVRTATVSGLARRHIASNRRRTPGWSRSSVAEVEAQRRRRQARPVPEPAQRRLGVLGHLRRAAGAGSPRRSPGRSCRIPARRCAEGPTPAAPWKSRACCRRRTRNPSLEVTVGGRPREPRAPARGGSTDSARVYRSRRPGGRGVESPVRSIPAGSAGPPRPGRRRSRRAGSSASRPAGRSRRIASRGRRAWPPAGRCGR